VGGRADTVRALSVINLLVRMTMDGWLQCLLAPGVAGVVWPLFKTEIGRTIPVKRPIVNAAAAWLPESFFSPLEDCAACRNRCGSFVDLSINRCRRKLFSRCLFRYAASPTLRNV